MGSKAMENELVELFEKVKKAADRAAIDEGSVEAEEQRCLDALALLASVPVTMSALISSQVGKRLRNLTKHPRENIRSVAQDILESWKKVVTSETTANNGNKASKSERSESIKVERKPKIEPESIIVEKKQKVELESIKVEKKPKVEPEFVKVEKKLKVEAESTGIKKASSSLNGPPKLSSMIKCNDVKRDKFREILAEAFSKVYTEVEGEHLERVNACDPIRVAVSVESVMFEKLGRFDGSQKVKYRSIMFNLKDGSNPDLRRRVLLGEIKPDKLIVMTAEEMASDQRKLENKQIKAKNVTIAVSKPPEIKVVASVPQKKRRRKRSKSSGSRIPPPPPSLPARTPTECYYDTLVDPFEYDPCRIGFGTFVDTVLGTAYLRVNTTTFTDGSIAAIITPSVGYTYGQCFYNNSGVGSSTWTSATYTNSSALATDMQEARIVSGAVRILPSVAGSAAPGYFYAGCLPSMSNNDIASNTINQLISTPQLKMGYAATGGLARIYPIDPVSYQFNASTITGVVNSTTAKWNTSVAACVATGLPSSSPVVIEFVLNLEGIQNFNSSTSTLQGTGQRPGNTPTLLNDHYSLDHMWAYIKDRLPSSGQLSQAGAVASAAMQGFKAYKRIHAGFFGSAGHNMLFNRLGPNLPVD